MENAIKAYLAKIGAKGGRAKGKSKLRGSKAYYKRISALGVKARKAKSAKERR
jgi:hypothetical protein